MEGSIMHQKLKHVTEDVCEVRYNSLMTAMTDMKTDVRLLTESFDRHKMKSIECTTKLGVCMTGTKKSIDGIQKDINTLVDNCTKTKQEPKGGIHIGNAVALKLITWGTVITLLIYGIIFKGDPELLTSSAIKVLGG